MEAIRVTLPSSIHSNRLCCCFLFRYWISSRYSRMPPAAASVPISLSTALISPVPQEVPLSLCRVMPLFSAMMRATVVFPVPEGP